MAGTEAMPRTECELKHKALSDKVGVHETRLNAHAAEIDELKLHDAENRNEIKHLLGSIETLANNTEKLVANTKWLIGTVVAVTSLMIGAVGLLINILR